MHARRCPCTRSSSRSAARHTWATRTGPIIDCRFDLARPDWGAGAYRGGHIPARALRPSRSRSVRRRAAPRSGRHPLPDPAALAATFGRLGIDATVQVIAYDQGTGAFAARLWWLLRWLGHRAGRGAQRRLRGLGACWAAGEQRGRRVPARQFTRARRTAGAAGEHRGSVRRRRLRGAQRRRAASWSMRAAPTASPARTRPSIRSPATFRARAISPSRATSMRDGRFLAAGELRAALAAHACAAAQRTQLIAMCGSGVTACHNLLALEVAGLPGGAAVRGLLERVDPRPGAARSRAERER